MKCTIFLFQLVLPFASILAPVAEATSALLVKSSSPQCEGDFELEEFVFSCGNECLFGSTANVSGEIVSEYGFYEYQLVNLEVCPLSYGWSCFVYENFEANLCDHVVALDGQECPSPGNYTFAFQHDLPGGGGQGWLWGWTFKLSATFYTTQSSTACVVEVITTTSKYQMLWSITGIAFFASAIAFRSRRRNLVCGTQCQPAPSNEGIEFQELKDVPGVYSGVRV